MRRLLAALLGVSAICLLASPAGASDTAPTGTPVCVAKQFGGAYPGLDAGLSTTALGNDAPAYYEVGAPSGSYAGQPPKGVMIVIHGGGWYLVGKSLVAAIRPRADRWRSAGWRTVNIDYRACGNSVNDVFWFMNRIRSRYPQAVVCASGSSAGAHLALLLASIRKDVACVMAYAALSDLLSINQQTAYDPTTLGQQSLGPVRVSQLAIAAFGANPSPLVKASPMRYAPLMTSRVLLASGVTDPQIPVEQNANFASAVKAAHPENYVDVALLAGGTVPFVHTSISQAAADDLKAREDALVAPFA